MHSRYVAKVSNRHYMNPVIDARWKVAKVQSCEIVCLGIRGGIYMREISGY
jgi:hypothetical protein